MSDNTCSICLEPLLVATAAGSEESVGAVVPCGHCFHSNCFALWKANKGSHCKCPNCNKPAKSCMKLFIAPAENAMQHMEDDDVSLDSSTSSNASDNKDDEETTTRNAESNSTSVRDTSSSMDINSSISQNSIVVLDLTETSSEPSHLPPMIDLTSTPPRQSKTASQSTTGSDRYKRIAKQYKRRFQQKESQLRELHQEHQSFRQTVRTVKEELGEIRTELKSRDDMTQHFNAQMDGANLQIIRLERELQESNQQRQRLRREVDTWENRYSELEKSLNDAVKKASNANMAEIKQIMEERPKILAENQRLTHELAQAKEQLAHRQRSRPSANLHDYKRPPTMDASGDGHANKKRKAMAKELRAMHEVLHFSNDRVHPLEDISQPARTTLSSRVAKGDSSTAVSTASAKRKVPPQSQPRGARILTEKSNTLYAAASRSQTLESTGYDMSRLLGWKPTLSVAERNAPMRPTEPSALKPCLPDKNDPRRVQRLDESAGPRSAFLNLSRPKNNKVGSSSLLFRQINK